MPYLHVYVINVFRDVIGRVRLATYDSIYATECLIYFLGIVKCVFEVAFPCTSKTKHVVLVIYLRFYVLFLFPFAGENAYFKGEFHLWCSYDYVELCKSCEHCTY